MKTFVLFVSCPFYSRTFPCFQLQLTDGTWQLDALLWAVFVSFYMLNNTLQHVLQISTIGIRGTTCTMQHEHYITLAPLPSLKCGEEKRNFH